MVKFSFYIVFLILTFVGCTHLRLQSVRQSPENWIMYGGDAGHCNSARYAIKPPLEVVWTYDASAGFSPYSASATDSFLFVGNLRGEVHAINISTGDKVGAYNFGSAIVGTPIIDKDMLYVALTNNEDGIVAYNLYSGSIVWKTKIGSVESSPLLLQEHIFLTTLDGKLVCLNKNNGSIVWKYEVPTFRRTKMIHSSPASNGNVVVFGSDNGHLYAVGIDDGKYRWSTKTGSSIFASPSIRYGKVYVGSLDSNFYAFDVETGEQIWKQSLNAKIYASQAVDEKHVYIGTVDRMLYCLKTGSGDIIWKINTGGAINSAPLVSNNIVYIGCINNNLYTVDCETGKLLWQYKTDGRVKTMPVISKNFLFVLSEDRTVIALKQNEQK